MFLDLADICDILPGMTKKAKQTHMTPERRTQIFGAANRMGVGVFDQHLPKSPRLSTLAKIIEELWPDLHVRLRKFEVNTDRKVGRLRIQGRGRKGNRLRVWFGEELVDPYLLDHRSAEPYRHNGEVCQWIKTRLMDEGR